MSAPTPFRARGIAAMASAAAVVAIVGVGGYLFASAGGRSPKPSPTIEVTVQPVGVLPAPVTSSPAARPSSAATVRKAQVPQDQPSTVASTSDTNPPPPVQGSTDPGGVLRASPPPLPTISNCAPYAPGPGCNG